MGQIKKIKALYYVNYIQVFRQLKAQISIRLIPHDSLADSSKLWLIPLNSGRFLNEEVRGIGQSFAESTRDQFFVEAGSKISKICTFNYVSKHYNNVPSFF